MPANLRVRGVNVQLDLKIDDKTIAAATERSRINDESMGSAGGGTSHSGGKPSMINFSVKEPPRSSGY